MAILLRGVTVCKICGRVIEAQDDAISFPHFIGDEKNKFYPFSDSVLHRNCFLNWDMRIEFVSNFNSIMENYPIGGGRYRKMVEDGAIVIRQH